MPECKTCGYARLCNCWHDEHDVWHGYTGCVHHRQIDRPDVGDYMASGGAPADCPLSYKPQRVPKLITLEEAPDAQA